MRAVKNETLDELEEMALASAKAIRAYLTYQGTNKDYEKKARVATAGISSYSRLRASETNREAIELAAHRMNGDEPKKLSE